MIKLRRLRKGGFHYDEINDWCKRMVATTIMSESSIFLADRRQYASDTFHVFDRVVLVGEKLTDGMRSDFYQVYLSQWQLNNLNHGYVLPLDFNAYLELKRDISKALFGHLAIPGKAITESELMAIRIPKEADRRRSEATLDCSYHAEVIGIRQSLCV